MSGGRLRSGLVIPSSVTSVRPPLAYCHVIVDDEGGMCGKPLYSPKDIENHVTKCATRNLEFIRKASLRERLPGIFGSFDPEAEGWVSKHAQEIIEGRKGFYGKPRRMQYAPRKKRRRG